MRIRGRPYAVDANVILRYLLQDDEELSSKAAAIMEAVDDGHVTLLLDPVTLAEVVWVLSSYYRTPRERIGEGLGPILKADGVAMPGKARYIRTLDLYSHSSIHFGDACACAPALEECEGRLLSFDRKLSRVEGVRRIESADRL